MSERLKEMLHQDRSACKARGHDWGVADVLAVVDRYEQEERARVQRAFAALAEREERELQLSPEVKSLRWRAGPYKGQDR